MRLPPCRTPPHTHGALLVTLAVLLLAALFDTTLAADAAPGFVHQRIYRDLDGYACVRLIGPRGPIGCSSTCSSRSSSYHILSHRMVLSAISLSLWLQPAPLASTAGSTRGRSKRSSLASWPRRLPVPWSLYWRRISSSRTLIYTDAHSTSLDTRHSTLDTHTHTHVERTSSDCLWSTRCKAC